MPLLALASVFAILISWVCTFRPPSFHAWAFSLIWVIRQHEITDAVRLVYAFKHSQQEIGGDLYYANVASALSLVKTSVYLVVTILFDGFIVGFSRVLCATIALLTLITSFTAAGSSGIATAM